MSFLAIWSEPVNLFCCLFCSDQISLFTHRVVVVVVVVHWSLHSSTISPAPRSHRLLASIPLASDTHTHTHTLTLSLSLSLSLSQSIGPPLNRRDAPLPRHSRRNTAGLSPSQSTPTCHRRRLPGLPLIPLSLADSSSTFLVLHSPRRWISTVRTIVNVITRSSHRQQVCSKD